MSGRETRHRKMDSGAGEELVTSFKIDAGLLQWQIKLRVSNEVTAVNLRCICWLWRVTERE